MCLSLPWFTHLLGHTARCTFRPRAPQTPPAYAGVGCPSWNTPDSPALPSPALPPALTAPQASRDGFDALLRARQPGSQLSRGDPGGQKPPRPGLGAGGDPSRLRSCSWQALGLSDVSDGHPGGGGRKLQKPDQPEPRAPETQTTGAGGSRGRGGHPGQAHTWHSGRDENERWNRIPTSRARPGSLKSLLPC